MLTKKRKIPSLKKILAKVIFKTCLQFYGICGVFSFSIAKMTHYYPLVSQKACAHICVKLEGVKVECGFIIN